MMDLYVAIGLAGGNNTAEGRSLQRTDSSKMPRRDSIALGKFREAGHDFVAFGKNHNVGLSAVKMLGDRAGAQSGRPAPIRDRAGPGVTFRHWYILRLSQDEAARRQKATRSQTRADPLPA